jgi:hypothetical protein
MVISVERVLESKSQEEAQTAAVTNINHVLKLIEDHYKSESHLFIVLAEPGSYDVNGAAG